MSPATLTVATPEGARAWAEGQARARAQRDSQRSKIYAAEDAAFNRGFSEGLTVGECQAIVDKVLASRTVRERYPRADLPVLVADGRGRRSACYAATRYGRPTLCIPRSLRSKWVVLHELAHHLTHKRGVPHGWEFAECFLYLVRVFIGRHAEARLKQEMKARRVKYAPPRRSTMTDDQREAARQRMLAINAARRGE